MPATELTPEQRKAAQTALDKHLKACPVCRTTEFALGVSVTFLPTMDGASVNLGTGQPCVSAICQTCGSVQLFNVFFLGLDKVLGITPDKDTENG